MKPPLASRLAVLGLLAASATAAEAPRPVRLTIDTTRPGPEVSPIMHGIFFEDINYGADGGLYAELVQNRSFEHRDRLFAWSPVNLGGEGSLEIQSSAPIHPNNPHFVRLTVNRAGQGFGLANSGFDGIAVRRDETYRVSVRARAGAAFRGALVAELQDEPGRSLGRCRLTGVTDQWSKLEGRLRSDATATNARLVVLATAPGTLDLDVISLFPVKTWKQRRNGLRPDLAQLLADMKPGFMRFPGGCIVEGKDLANAYRWKDTVGDIAERRQNWNRWQDAVGVKAPQYYQTCGLGFFEYFQFCEDLDAEPVPVLNCGMSCQFQDQEFVPVDALGPWIQDALDLMEFARGPATSRWGAVRAAMGHPAPFPLKRLGVGNEQWGEEYFARYLPFYRALKARYPDLEIVTTAGPGVNDRWWDLAWGKFRGGTPADIVDEHYYRPPQWFLDHADRYDAYDRHGPKVFAGEFAAHDGGAKRNNLRAALAEAAFMTGLLRNADVVRMAAYAPLLARAGHAQWWPNLIWFDATRACGTPSYHVQAMYARNRPDVVLPASVEAGTAAPAFGGRIGVGAWLTEAEFKDIEVTRDGRVLFRSDFRQGLAGWETRSGQWSVVDGALRQSTREQNVQAFIGDPAWTDYTLSLKARKLGGQEGFLITFQSTDPGVPNWWNLGGWGNLEHGLELAGSAGPRVPGRIETGRWYDIRVEVSGPSVKCFLDGQLLQQMERKTPRALYVAAGRDRKAGETVVFLANPFARVLPVEVDLRGARVSRANASVLTSASPDDENSLDAPDKVAPRPAPLKVQGAAFNHTLPAHSFTVLRLKTE